MNYLTKFTPAETLIFLEMDKVLFRELLKATFLDLLLKKVLMTKRKSYKPSANDPYVTVKHVCAGSNLKLYKTLTHETIFVDAFKRSKNMEPLLRHYVTLVNENAINRKTYLECIKELPNVKPYLMQSFWQKLFGGFGLTKEGESIAKGIDFELGELDILLPELIKNNKREALTLIKKVNGNIFFLNNLDLKQLHLLDIKELGKPEDEVYFEEIPDGCSAGTQWDSFEGHSHSFDSSCGTSNGSDNSGCGSSGCSGCGGSGCGGGD